MASRRIRRRKHDKIALLHTAERLYGHQFRISGTHTDPVEGSYTVPQMPEIALSHRLILSNPLQQADRLISRLAECRSKGILPPCHIMVGMISRNHHKRRHKHASALMP